MIALLVAGVHVLHHALGIPVEGIEQAIIGVYQVRGR
jgi:hypothetical protein